MDETIQLSDDKTQLGGPEEAIRCCPKCGAINRLSELPKRDYRCGDCGLELAHLDTTAQGIIRGVLSWLRAPGEVVHGRYRITGILGKGGFGATYLIEDELLHGKRRALKEIPELLFDEYEARLLGRLNHPAIPDITDRFSEDGTIYLVLEFGGTRTLRGEQERRGGRIPLFVLLPWIRQLCAAIRYLHQQTPPVVHRDLKPENILLDDEDRVMLIDFGIAKEAAPDSATRTLGRAASQGFSPPEQVLGTGTDERSDVYALGAIVYNLLSGQLPAAAYARVTGASIEPLRSFLPEIPPAIEAVVLQALELNINLRPQSVEEFARVFEQLDNPQSSAATQMTEAARGGVSTANDGLPSVRIPSLSLTLGTSTDATSVPAPAPAPASSRLGLMLLALIAVAGLGGGTWWLLNRLPPEPEPAAESASGSASGSIAESASTAVEASPGTAANPDVESAAATPVEPEETAETGAASASPAAASTAAASANAATAERAPPLSPETAAALGTGAALLGSGATAPAPLPAQSGAATTASAPMPPSSASLPSIFSDEQATRASARPSPRGSLLEIFESERSQRLAEPQPEPEPAQAKATPAPDPTPPAAAPEPVKASRARPEPLATPPQPKPRPKPAPQPAPQPSPPSSASDWGFQYKGAEKQY